MEQVRSVVKDSKDSKWGITKIQNGKNTHSLDIFDLLPYTYLVKTQKAITSYYYSKGVKKSAAKLSGRGRGARWWEGGELCLLPRPPGGGPGWLLHNIDCSANSSSERKRCEAIRRQLSSFGKNAIQTTGVIVERARSYNVFQIQLNGVVSQKSIPQ